MKLSLTIILKRVAVLLGVTTDTAVAKGLGVAPQTLSTWKRRGTIPYERICLLAEEKDVSLDYLLLGKGAGEFSGGDINPILLEAIEHELMNYDSSLIQRLLPNYAHDISLIYNRINRQIKPGMSYGELITDEVKYFIDIATRYDAQENRVHSRKEKPYVYDEEQRHINKIGASVEEIYGLPAANPIETDSDNPSYVKQEIKGKGHQVAGRDVVNEGAKKKK